MAGYCFVIQPFDGAAFDRRYSEVFSPAIKLAGLEPYRVDQDPGASIPIEQIETRILGASACLADITLDNPNVWFELGYALAAKKEICLVCASSRISKYPFDVQHRNIIRYGSESPSDFATLKDKIAGRLIAIQNAVNTMAVISARSPLKGDDGLSQHEIMVLASIMSNRGGPMEGVSHWTVQQALDKQGFNNLGVNIGIERLLRNKMIRPETERDYNDEPYTIYHIEDSGADWLLSNVEKLDLASEGSTSKRMKQPFGNFAADLDEEIPF